MNDGEEIRFIEMFAGIGGFRLGLERADSDLDSKQSRKKGRNQVQKRVSADTSTCNGSGGRKNPFYRCVWANENNKYANQIYKKNFGDKELVEGDIREIKAKSIPDCDLLTAGFPCQAFSVAGKRKATQEARGTLFTHIIRVASAKRPKLLLLENVKGILSSESGRTFAIILRTLANLGYLLEWQVLNSKHYGVPQNRERVFIIGHFRGEGGRQIFPIGETGKAINEVRTVARTLQGGGHSGGLHSNMTGLISKSVRSGGRGSLDRHMWDLIQVGNVDQRGHNSLWGRVYSPEGISPNLNAEGGGLGAKTGLIVANAVDCDGYLRFGQRPRDKDGKPQLLPIGYRRIRRLTPTECERLQGFPDGWTEWGIDENGKKVRISDTQRYKCLGNAITTNVVTFLGKILSAKLKLLL